MPPSCTAHAHRAPHQLDALARPKINIRENATLAHDPPSTSGSQAIGHAAYQRVDCPATLGQRRPSSPVTRQRRGPAMTQEATQGARIWEVCVNPPAPNGATVMRAESAGS